MNCGRGGCDREFEPVNGRQLYCKDAECAKLRKRERWNRYIEDTGVDLATYQKGWSLQKRYGLTLSDWHAMLVRAGHCCEICGSTEELCVDHCHQTNQIRGVLCRNCNRSIGGLGDTLEAIRKVIKYLVRYELGEGMHIPCPRCYSEGPHEKVAAARDGSSRTVLCDRCHLEWQIHG